jgi:hypothetical protein
MADCPVAYPREAPLGCVRRIVQIVRSGSVRADRAELAKHAWVVQGYLQRVAFGDPSEPAIVAAAPGDDEEMCRVLESAFERPEFGGAVLDSLDAQRALPIPAALLLKWLLTKLLEELFRPRALRAG